ncbi:sigma-70 family RNA polymerase sigma factor [Geobacillus stearothermophilus]
MKLINGEWLTMEQVIEKHIGLVRYVVRKNWRMLKKHRIEYEDAISVGMQALVKAYQQFSDGHKCKFSTYAIPKIWGELQNFILDNSSILYFPRSTRHLARKISKLQLDQGDPAMIAKTLGVTVEQVERAMEVIRNYHIQSLSELAYNHSDGREITIEDQLNQEEDFSSVVVKEFLDTLTSREKQIVLLLALGYPYSRIANELGVTIARVGQIVKGIREKYMEYNGWSNETSA